MFKRFSLQFFFVALSFSLSAFDAHSEYNHIYTLTESAVGNFLLNLPEVDDETGELVSKTYNLEFPAPFGNADGEESLGYEWKKKTLTTDGTMGKITEDVNFLVSSDAPDLIFSFSESDYTGLLKGDDIELNNTMGEYGGISVISPVLHVLSGQTTSVENVLYWDNTRMFKGRSGRAYSGLIYNIGTIENITADFIKNRVFAEEITTDSIDWYTAYQGWEFYGGAITSLGAIGQIEGNFIENGIGENAYKGYGGAIFLSGSEVDTISGNFIKNYVSTSGLYFYDGGDAETAESLGGAIYIDLETSVNNIKANFIGNYVGNLVALKAPSRGGAIFSRGTLGSVEGDFIGNYATSTGGAIASYQGEISSISGRFAGNVSTGGGAIFIGSDSSVESLSADFVANTVIMASNWAQYFGSWASGGAVLNVGEIGEISGNFIGNEALASAYYGAEGGAIRNSGTISKLSANFYGNFATYEGDETSYPGMDSNASGGAIYNSGSINIVADGQSVTYRGNGIKSGDVQSAEAIYHFGNRLSLEAVNGGVINMYDDINSLWGQIYPWLYYDLRDVNLQGDSSGTLNLYGQIKNLHVITDGAFKLNTENGEVVTYDFTKLTSDEDTKYYIDVDVENEKSDVFKTTEASSGTVTLHGLRFSNLGDTATNQTMLFQILQTPNNDLQLALASEISCSETFCPIGMMSSSSAENIVARNLWSKDYYKDERIKEIVGSIELATKDTTNDSIVINLNNIKDGGSRRTMLGDTLALLTAADLGETKYFTINSADAEYVLGARFEEAVSGEYVAGVGTIEGQLQVSGLLSGDKRSVLNLNNRKGFEYGEESELFLSDIEVVNANGAVVGGVGSDMMLVLNNTNLKNNGAVDGAVIDATEGNVFVSATGADSVFDNPGAKSAINMKGGNLNLHTFNNGHIIFNDEIAGEVFDMNIYDDAKGGVRFNENVSGVNDLTIETSEVALGSQVVIDAQEMFANGSSSLILDTEVDRANNTVNTAKINVSGDIGGTLGIIVNSLNINKLDNDDDAITPFLIAPNDDPDTETNITVNRVIGSPYMWEAIRNARGEGEDEGSTWYLGMRSDGVGGEEEVAPEVVGAVGLHESAIEQTRNLARDVSVNALKDVWVLVDGQSAHIKRPADVKAKIKGITAGFDVQSDAYNKLGFFASYANGDYKLSGKGKKIFSNIGAKTDIDSYLAGLYYHFEKAGNFAFASLYGGIEKADVKTKDGAAKFSTDGVLLGAALEAGKDFELENIITITPMAGLYYTQINFESANDNVGKRYKWDTVKHLEAELGLKLAKAFANGDIYIKPSIVQNFTGGDKVKITGMDKLTTYEDGTLGRFELGSSCELTDKLSGYINGKYTFGSSYNALSGMLGLSYRF